MRGPGKSCLLKGFENTEFRRAVFSFLKEKCPEQIQTEDDLTVRLGLHIIREFILRKKAERGECPALAAI